MKLLITVALFAVACAVDEIKVVHLPEAPAPAFEQHESIDYMRPLIIPQAFFESLMAQQVQNEDVFRVNVVDESAIPPFVAYDYSVAEETGDAETFKVNFVEAPVQGFQVPEAVVYQSSVAEESDGVQAYIADPEPLKFQFLGSPVQDFQAPEEVVADAESFKVNFVDSPVEEPQAPAVVAYQYSVAEESDGVEAYIADPESQKVQFVDSPVQDFHQAPEPIILAEAALPESVVEYNFSEDHVAVDESTKVRFVGVPMQDFQAPEPIKLAGPALPEIAIKYNFSEDHVADDESTRVEDSPVEDSFGAERIEPVFESEVPSVDAVRVVDAARLGKLFADSRLR